MIKFHIADTASSIRRLRKERGFTLADLDYHCGFAGGTIRNYEQGINRPASDHLVALSRALDVTTDEILGIEHVHKDR